jgi:MATE family multidrug resistance protein
MLTWQRTSTISALAFPIGIALSSTLAMGLIDLAMVRTLGIHTIAAVGFAVYCNSLVVAFVVGIAPVVQGTVARRRGEGSAEPRCLPLNAGLLTALLVGVPVTVIGWVGSPFLFSLISSDPAVTRVGVSFLKALCLGVAAIGLNSAFKGYWYGVEKPKVFMGVVLVMSCLNFSGNLVLIHGRFGVPALGATGAAISTVISLYIGVVINFVLVRLLSRDDGFLKARPARSLVLRIFRLGLPVTLQEFTFALGYVVFLWMVGQIGTPELAAANVLIKISMVLVLLAMSLGTASATLVSKSLGAGDPAGAASWGWDAGKLGVIGISLLGVPLFLFPVQVLSVFLSDPHTISLAVLPLQMVAATTGGGSLIYIFAYTLYSVGDASRVVMVSFVSQWVLFLPAVWIVGPHLKYGLLQIWYVQMAYGALLTTLMTAIWAQGRWKTIRL